MLELKKITKIYEVANMKQKALNKINIKFRKNEFVSILGQSGSGKTTMLNIIGGLDSYTSGDLIINGISTKEYNDRDWDTYRNHKVGFVFQNYNLIPHQTALQNVELALTLSGIDKKERRKRSIEVLKKVGLSSQINKRPNQMSGGQMQRIAIARALVNDPDILLADEPTGALDSETSLQIMDLLSEIAKDRLVIMVTHNPELAVNYSTRIVKLLDGEIIDDTNPLDMEEIQNEEVPKNKSKKTSMNFKTALSLSLNNLMTKKGRTILTAFAGSIGIIGIAAILSLSNGIQKYIDRVEEETLSSYPITIAKEERDMSSLMESISNSMEVKDYDDDKIHSLNIMGDLLTTLSKEVKKNDLESFKKYLEKDGSKINDYVSSVEYGYNIQMNLYKNNDKEVLQVNPTRVFDSLGMGMSGMSSAYGTITSNYNVFNEMFSNEDLLHQQYELVSGSWPKNYNEMVLVVNDNMEVVDYTLYSLGLLDQKDLQKQFMNLNDGKEVSFEQHSFDKDEIIGLTFKLVLNTDYYEKNKQTGSWLDKSLDTSYMQKIINSSEEVKIVGIIKAADEAIVNSNAAGTVLYSHELTEHLINKINESEIVKEQKSNEKKNVFTNSNFTLEEFDENNLSSSEKLALLNMNDIDKTSYLKTLKENYNNSINTNLSKLGVCDLSNPDEIRIYPKNFDSKEEIEKIIDEYNDGKDENDKITYTDMVKIMMSSVSTIVNVISTVLIAFVAISLIVSSIMIAIITYISVIERTKEIGILRAIGASKKDISRVFNAETLIEGLASGVLGIVVTLILTIPANIIIKKVTDISNLTKLPILGAIILIIISVLLTVIAGFIPAKIASKKDPVEALRTE